MRKSWTTFKDFFGISSEINKTKLFWVPRSKLRFGLESESEDAQSCPTLRNPMDCSLPGSSVYGIFPGKNTGVGCRFLLQVTS